jgi:oxygen-dependent protoporphyrinogen oxidase
MEEKSRSLIRASLHARKRMAAARPAGGSSERAAPLFTSLRSGMQTMVHAIISRLSPERLHTGTEVHAVALHNDQWSVTTAAGTQSFDAVIIASPAYVAGSLLRGVDAKLATELQAIPYSSSVTVNLVYDTAAVPGLQGFGFLIPRTEGRKLLAVTYTHNKFPHRAASGKAILRCFFGGAQADAMLELSDAEITAIARGELRQILKLSAEPLTVRVNRWRRAMAQYAVGHLARVAEIERRCGALPGLALAGNGYHGIGVPDAVRSGMQAVTLVTRTPQRTPAGGV